MAPTSGTFRLFCAMSAAFLLLFAAAVPAPAAVPRAVTVAGVTDSSFVVTWRTDEAVAGAVRYGTAPGALDRVVPGDAGQARREHAVRLESLAAETVYFFTIESGGETFPLHGVPWHALTGAVLGLTTPQIAYGQVFEADGVTPAAAAAVFLSGQRPGEQSALLYAPIAAADGGYWSRDLGGMRTGGHDDYFQPAVGVDVFNVRVCAGPRGSAETAWSGVGLAPAPALTLGPPMPRLDPPPGLHFAPLTVTASHPDPGLVIRYTTDGTLPGETAAVYDGPLAIAGNTFLRVRAFPAGGIPSAAAGGRYVIETGVPGDVSQDGAVTVADALSAWRMALGRAVTAGEAVHRPPYPEIWHRADLDGDRALTRADVLAALRAAVGAAD